MSDRRRYSIGIALGIVLVLVARTAVNRTPVADWLVGPLIQADTDGRADAIVVPGAGVIGDCVPNLHAVRRVLLASREWKAQRAPLVVFAGGTGQADCPVALAMGRLAQEVGIDRASIHLETFSLNTRENAERSDPLLRALGVRRVLVVTDRLHMRRASAAFARQGFEIERASVPIYEGHPDNLSMLQAGIREFVALAYYRTRDWTAGAWSPSARAAEPPRPVMTESEPLQKMSSEIRFPSGPIALLGASYAGGWDLRSVGGVPIVNRGVAGEQSLQMLDRFERDIVPTMPRAVILWGFINDISQAAPGDTESAPARARDNFVRMIALARTHGIAPILTTELTMRPPPVWTETVMAWVGGLMGKEAYQDRVNRYVMAGNRLMVELARQEGLLLLDLQAVVSEPGGRRRWAFSQADGSHVTPEGYAALTEYATPALERYVSGR